MLGTLEALKDKVSGYVEKAQDKIVEKLVAHLHPQVHSVIDTRVDAFRDNTLEVRWWRVCSTTNSCQSARQALSDVHRKCTWAALRMSCPELC